MVDSAEAIHFLVQQVIEQASREDVWLSEFERRMMYSSEGGMYKSEFLTQYNLIAYEAKISTLLHNAYDRLRKGEPEKADRWRDSIQTLANEDHYLSEIWHILSSSERSSK